VTLPRRVAGYSPNLLQCCYRRSHASPSPKSTKIQDGIVNPNDESADKDKKNKLNTFNGIANWFSKSIHDCQRMIKPLHDACANGWTWGDDQETAFKALQTYCPTCCNYTSPAGRNQQTFRGPQLAQSILQKCLRSSKHTSSSITLSACISLS